MTATVIETPQSTTCDAKDCPAKGVHEVLVCGQDFRFCGHHVRELEVGHS